MQDTLFGLWKDHFLLSMLSRQRKTQLVEELSDVVTNQDNVILVDFAGLSTSELDDIKGSIRSVGGKLRVIKKSLLPFVSKKTGINLNLEEHPGSVAFVYGEIEGIETAKAVSKFSKAHEKLVILGGVFQKVFAGPEKVRELSTISSREELVGKLIYILNPAGALVRVISSPMAGLMNVLSNIKN